MADTPTSSPEPAPAQSAPARQPGPASAPWQKETGTPTASAAAGGQRVSPSEQHDTVKPQHMGFDATRPFRYGWAFVTGTLYDMFDKAANWGRKGMWLGGALGVVAWMSQATGAPALLTSLVAATGVLVPGSIIATMGLAVVGGIVLGMALGGLTGALTGGMRGVGRAGRKEKYADELATREEMREEATVRGPTYRDVMARNHVATNYNYDRMQQQQRENQQDDRRFWRDRVDNEHHHGHGHGHGF